APPVRRHSGRRPAPPRLSAAAPPHCVPATAARRSAMLPSVSAARVIVLQLPWFLSPVVSELPSHAKFDVASGGLDERVVHAIVLIGDIADAEVQAQVGRRLPG